MTLYGPCRDGNAFAASLASYMGNTDPVARASGHALRDLRQSPLFEYITCKWNSFYIPDCQSLAAMVVHVTFNAGHDCLDRLYEIGNLLLLNNVMHLYLRHTLHPEPPVEVDLTIPLCRWVLHCLSVSCCSCPGILSDPDHVLSDVSREVLVDRVRQMASRCTQPEMVQAVVVLAVLVRDWTLVTRMVDEHDLPLPFCNRLLMWVVCRHCPTVPMDVRESLIESMLRTAEAVGLTVRTTTGRGGFPASETRRNVPHGSSTTTKTEIEQGVDEVNLVHSATHAWWQRAEKLLERQRYIPEGETVHYVVLCAVRRRTNPPRWGVVRRLLPLCFNKSVLLGVFRKAATSAVTDVAKSILHLLWSSLCCPPAVFSVFINCLLENVHDNSTNRTLLQLCAWTGMSTHWVFSLSDVCSPLFGKNPSSLTELVVQIGLVSYKDCFEHLRQFGGSTENGYRQRIVDNMQREGTRPLLGVCVLTISHSMGCRPERVARIHALPLPAVVKTRLLCLRQ